MVFGTKRAGMTLVETALVFAILVGARDAVDSDAFSGLDYTGLLALAVAIRWWTGSWVN